MLAEKTPVMMTENGLPSSPTLDDFDIFCLLAGHTSKRLQLSYDYGGSLPCIPEPTKEEGGEELKSRGGKNNSNFLEVQDTKNGFLSVPTTPNMRRTCSDSGDCGLLVGHTNNCRCSSSSPAKNCHLKKTPSKGHQPPQSLGKKPKPLKLWSSIRNLVSSCDSSPRCLSPTPTSPTLLTIPVPKCPSAPHSRTSSVKRHLKQKLQDSDSQMRPRTSSMPTKNNLRRPQYLSIEPPQPSDVMVGDHAEDWCRVRNFVTTPKKVINCGDSFRSKSTSSVRSFGSCGSGLEDESHGSATSGLSQEYVVPLHTVQILGAAGVGKTTLTQQFLTSECLVEADDYAEFDGCTRVPILLNDEEAIIELREVSSEQTFHEDLPSDAYVVVYSTTDRKSFQHAVELLYAIRKEQGLSTTIVLVANKTDLVRLRHVAEQEGRAAAENYSCKYMEVSVLMNFNVDELLAGILTQIRLHQFRSPSEKAGKSFRNNCRTPIGLLGKYIKKKASSSRSCDNLLVL